MRGKLLRCIIIPTSIAGCNRQNNERFGYKSAYIRIDRLLRNQLIVENDRAA